MLYFLSEDLTIVRYMLVIYELQNDLKVLIFILFNTLKLLSVYSKTMAIFPLSEQILFIHANV